MSGSRLADMLTRMARRWIAFSSPWLERALERWSRPTPMDSVDWATDAHAARLARDPLRARTLLHVIVLVVLLLILWAAVARIDEVTRGEAKVVPSRQLQVIQSLDGGIVSEIHAREGQIVDAGQLLVRIDATRFASALGENRAQRLSLLAKTARLAALAEGKPFDVPPEVLAESPELAAAETRLYQSSLAELRGPDRHRQAATGPAPSGTAGDHGCSTSNRRATTNSPRRNSARPNPCSPPAPSRRSRSCASSATSRACVARASSPPHR